VLESLGYFEKVDIVYLYIGTMLVLDIEAGSRPTLNLKVLLIHTISIHLCIDEVINNLYAIILT
jgi:hypothetical protein